MLRALSKAMWSERQFPPLYLIHQDCYWLLCFQLQVMENSIQIGVNRKLEENNSNNRTLTATEQRMHWLYSWPNLSPMVIPGQRLMCSQLDIWQKESISLSPRPLWGLPGWSVVVGLPPSQSLWPRGVGCSDWWGLSYLPTSYLSRNWGTSQSKFLRMNETKGKKKKKKKKIAHFPLEKMLLRRQWNKLLADLNTLKFQLRKLYLEK